MKAQYKRAQDEATQIWGVALGATDDHPYLLKKGLKSYGLRTYEGKKIIGGMKCDGALIVPIMQDNIIHSLQFISVAGEKRFLTSGRKSGGYFTIGDLSPDSSLCIAEGYATAVSIYMATGYPVIVAFDSGNIELVADFLMKKHPDVSLIICADDDYLTKNNSGLTKAKMCAGVTGSRLAIPDFGNSRVDGATDFNDLHQCKGLEAVKYCIDAAKKVTLIQNVCAEGIATVSNNKTKEQITFDYGGGRFEVSPKGVFFVQKDTDGKILPSLWICSPLFVIAKTRDAKSGAWGRLLEWHDDDKVEHQWAMPIELLQGDGADVRRELSRLGLAISPAKKARDLLASFLQVYPVDARARCVERLGWHGEIYVTPSEAIGQSDEIVVFQNAHAMDPAFSITGTVEEWRNHIGQLSSGNSRLVFALSAAFAPVLADILGENSGGFHLRGASSSGKTTALKISASVWGNPKAYIRLWRTTTNGLEGLAALHNDSLLILDELGQVEPKDSGESAYMLANGQGKTRATRNGSAKQAACWRLLFLSAGEESLVAIMARAGQKANVGQEIRLADIEADAGCNMGIFEDIHNAANPAAFALTLKDQANRYHGAVGRAWLNEVVINRTILVDSLLSDLNQFVEKSVPSGASGQISRVARRFGLVAIAGELATKFGLTGWNKGESTAAAQKCFIAWFNGFGGIGNREDRKILSQVRAFFEAHGGSRFGDINFPNDERIYNRAGFYRSGKDGDREYLVLTEIFKEEICPGFDIKLVIEALLKAGWLMPSKDRMTQKPRLQGFGSPRFYVINSQMWEAEIGNTIQKLGDVGDMQS